MTQQPERCCGTCRWWEYYCTGTIKEMSVRAGNCVSPMPRSEMKNSRMIMLEHEGTDCPCREPKESNQL